MDAAEIPPPVVVQHLERMLHSDAFRTASRSSKLLRFLVEETLKGGADRLKDYTLGTEVFGRDDSFDPRTDPIARVEASRLRSKLELYYATEGRSDDVVIALPKGGYVPRFERRSAVADSAPVVRDRRLWIPVTAASAAALIAVALLWRQPAGGQTTVPERRLEITTPPTTDPVSLAISPDGEKVVFVASDGGPPRLWLRPLNTMPAVPLRGTEHASLPFWSPDSRSVGFFADERIKRIDIDSGRVEEMRRAAVPGGATWNHNGVIVHAATVDNRLARVSAEGGPVEDVTALARGQTGHRAPHFLPDGEHFVYYAMGTADVRGIHLGSLTGNVSRRLFDADTPAVYTANHLLYVHQGTLFARRFDPARLTVEGEPIPIAGGVASGTRAGVAALSAAMTGPIVFRTGDPGGRHQFVWFDRTGRELSPVGSAHTFGPSYASMSPDGRRLAVQRTDAGNTDVWLIDVEHDTPIRFTTNPEADIAPLWSPDGTRIVFSSQRKGFQLYERAITAGTATPLIESEGTKTATDWSRDGRFVLFRSIGTGNSWDISAIRMEGDRKPFAVVQTKFEERDAQFSPDARWIAYQSNDSGRFEVYIQSFEGGGERVRISANGGVQPRWRRDGHELFYLALDGRLVAVPITLPSAGGRLEMGAAETLFLAPVASPHDVALRAYIVSDDGRRFLLDTIVEAPVSPIVIILNWKARVD